MLKVVPQIVAIAFAVFGVVLPLVEMQNNPALETGNQFWLAIAGNAVAAFISLNLPTFLEKYPQLGAWLTQWASDPTKKPAPPTPTGDPEKDKALAFLYQLLLRAREEISKNAEQEQKNLDAIIIGEGDQKETSTVAKVALQEKMAHIADKLVKPVKILMVGLSIFTLSNVGCVPPGVYDKKEVIEVEDAPEEDLVRAELYEKLADALDDGEFTTTDQFLVAASKARKYLGITAGGSLTNDLFSGNENQELTPTLRTSISEKLRSISEDLKGGSK